MVCFSTTFVTSEDEQVAQTANASRHVSLAHRGYFDFDVATFYAAQTGFLQGSAVT
jgi:hypothetical protein